MRRPSGLADKAAKLLDRIPEDPDSLLDRLLDPNKSGRGRVDAWCVDKWALSGADGLLSEDVEKSLVNRIGAIDGPP